MSKLVYLESSDPSPGHEVDGDIPGITAAALFWFEVGFILVARECNFEFPVVNGTLNLI